MGILRLLRTIRILRAIRAVRLKAKIVEAVSIRSAVYAPPHPPPASLRLCCFPPLTDQPCRIDFSQSRTGSRSSSAAHSSFLH